VFIRFYALYLRYAARHADRLAGFSLPRRHGRRLGNVERIWRADGATRIAGWTSATALRVSWPGGQVAATPHIQRSDVMHRFGLPIECGFEIDLPEAARDLTLHLTLADGAQIAVPLAHPSDPPTPAARRRLWRAFIRDLARSLPAGIRWVVQRDPAARTRIKHLLGLEANAEGLPIDHRFLGHGPVPRARHPITIIVPVHNAFDMVVACLRRVAAHTDLEWHLILVEDASTDPRVRPFLRGWADEHAGRVTLLELPENLGFVGAVNRGFAVAEGHAGHVVLLNSDAMVPADWASRLIAPFDRDPRIASVTPMSNNAEIFSVPFICAAVPLPRGMVDRIDAVAQTLTWPNALPPAPTGVGFCMAINARWFGREPRFDTAFGRGYGEEVDWCQKTRLAGARHVGLPTLFVEHRGGESFGAEAKTKAVLRANAMIARRYPSYDLEVQGFIGNDPLRTARLALAVVVAGELATGPLPLFIAHALGGGADHALRAEIAAYTAQGQYALVLRVGGPLRWQLEVHGPLGSVSGASESFDHIRRLLAPVPSLRVVYSCGVGDRNPIELPDAMTNLIRPARADRLEARLHDYFVISPSYCLLNADGAYRGPVLRDNPDPAHRQRRPEGGGVPLAAWQAAWEGFLARCDEITVFSESSQRHVLAVYPDLAGKIVYRPHATVAQITRLRPAGQGGTTLAVLGNLNRQKGAGVLCDLAERIARDGGPRLALIGNIDPAFSLPPKVRLHGSYLPADIPQLAERYAVGAWLVPSIWPETFSFVTHEMLATGLPVYGFDIGAQGDALRRAANGIPIPFDPDGDHAAAILAMLAQHGPWRARQDIPLPRLDKAAE
jgi:O-antigen biosynthesis protein